MAISVTRVTRETALNLRRNLLMTVAAILTAVVSLTLVGFALLLKQGVTKATLQWRGGVELNIFMKPDVEPTQNQAVEKQLASMDEFVKGYTYVNQTAAKAEFDKMFANSPDMVDSVKATDLPPSYRVVPNRAELVGTIGQRFEKQAGVQDVVYAKETIDKILRVARRAQIFFLGMAVVVLLAAATLIFVTIQMAIFARRREVAVMKLVGATNWFIRLPFMLEGLVQGLIGAGVAFAIVYLARNAVLGLVDTLFLGIGDRLFTTSAEAIGTGIFLLVVGAVVGALGAAVAVRRFLDV
ncbi:MAG: cell division transport system permease protein [Actinomycetota bacterium]